LLKAAAMNRWFKVCAAAGCILLQSIIGLDAGLTGSREVYAASPDWRTTSPTRSTWLWQTHDDLQDRERTLADLERNGINRVYLQADPDVPAGLYKAFIREARTKGIEVHALGGAPDWILPGSNVKMYVLINWVKRYNQNAAPEERFTGIHLDVEPYVLPQWQDDTDKMLGLFMDTISGFVQEVRAETGLAAGADLPVWLEQFQVRDGYGGRTTLSDWMIRRLDQTTLMAYRTRARDIVSSVSREMKEAARRGKSVTVAVETAEASEPDLSFYTEGRARMDAVLDEACRSFQAEASFAGFAVHDFENWRKLGP